MDRSSFTKTSAITTEALIIIDVHAMEVIEKLIKERVSNLNAFEWI